MEKFKYSALDKEGRRTCGVYIAHDERELSSVLLSSGLYLVSARRIKEKKKSELSFLGRVKISEIASLCRRFAIMQSSFIPLPDSLKLLCEQTENRALRASLSEVYKDVTEGAFLSDALRKHSRIFPDFMCSMIYVGELGGRLDTVLTSLADYYEGEVRIRRKFRTALEYPTIIFVMTLALAYLMLTFIVPTFKSTVSELGTEVTGLAAAVYSVSDFLTSYGLLLLACAFILILSLVLFFKSNFGRDIFDALVLKLPLIKTVEKNICASRLARSLGLLLSSGMSLDEALSASEVVVNNRHLKKSFVRAFENVTHGESFSASLAKEKIFPDTMLKMIEIGETTNSLDEVLLRSCTFLDLETENSLASLSSLLGPIMLSVMGAVIGVMFLAVYSPILSVINAF